MSIPSRATAAPLIVRVRSVVVLTIALRLGLRLFFEAGSFAFAGAKAHVVLLFLRGDWGDVAESIIYDLWICWSSLSQRRVVVKVFGLVWMLG